MPDLRSPHSVRSSSIRVDFLQDGQKGIWDNYVRNHPSGTLYHLSDWADVIGKTYRHNPYYLMAVREKENDLDRLMGKPAEREVVGVLPLIHLRHFFFGSRLVSIPFFDFAGVIAENEETEVLLRQRALKLAEELKAGKVELRQLNPFCSDAGDGETGPEIKGSVTKSEKVRMILPLAADSDTLLKSFKSKLRSQIQKPLKEGLTAKIGGAELVADFYDVFSANMRDLGSPVHSRLLIQNVMEHFSDRSRIIIVYRDRHPLACALAIGFGDTLENPWASSLRKFSHLSPNMLLYWTMLAFGCDHGYARFDFGRSTPGESTYRFKEQWGARPFPLYWRIFPLLGNGANLNPGREKYRRMIQAWKRLPLGISKWVGPKIRRHIDL